MTYDQWLTHDPRDDTASAYADMRDKLARQRGCDDSDISIEDIQQAFADDQDAEEAAMEEHADAEREERKMRGE